MAFSNVPYFVADMTTSATAALFLTATDVVAGARLDLQHFSTARFNALWNIDFDNGLFALTISGNALVLDAPAPQACGELLVLSQMDDSPTQRWDIHAKPGVIVSSIHHNFFVDSVGAGVGSNICLAQTALAMDGNSGNIGARIKLSKLSIQRWMLIPLISEQAKAFL